MVAMKCEEDNVASTNCRERKNRGKSSSLSSSSEDDDELMKYHLENAGKLNFDFEAYPLCESDKDSLVNLLTQIFLRADVDVEQIADVLVKQSPFGCVYRPAEEHVDVDNDVAYGVLSLVELGTNQKFHVDIWNLLKTRARKYAFDKKMSSILESMCSAESNRRVGLLINERLLHFPAAIAAPAFKSLKDDLGNFGSQFSFSDVILILKIRLVDRGSMGDACSSNTSRKKMTKAQKRRLAASMVADGETIYDNPEEELLFRGAFDFKYFQYPVQSEVEKDSKFGPVVLKGIIYRPYRRVCILPSDIFQQYIDLVSTAKGL